MRLLLDTHALIWVVREPHRLSAHASQIIASPANNIWVSAATAWEIAIKFHLGKLIFDPGYLHDFDGRLLASAYMPLPVTSRHATAGAALTSSHTDPFDRVIAAQALLEGLTVVTVDRAISDLGAQVVW